MSTDAHVDDLQSSTSIPGIMEEDDISFVEAPGDNPQVTYEKQLEALQLYLKSLPYECETPEQMQRALESIVGKIYIAVKAKNWAALGAWDYIFQW